MAKDSLTDAIFELKDRGRKNKKPSLPQPSKSRIVITNERSRAFDTFHVFSIMLLVLGLAVQVVALAVYA